jgi:hypothetical protein
MHNAEIYFLLIIFYYQILPILCVYFAGRVLWRHPVLAPSHTEAESRYSHTKPSPATRTSKAESRYSHILRDYFHEGRCLPNLHRGYLSQGHGLPA